MARRPSNIDRLPDELRAQIHAWLRDPGTSQLDAMRKANAIIDEINSQVDDGETLERVTKSSINRYAQRMDKAGDKIREARERAKMWIGELGAQPQGEVGKFINETLRTLSLDVTLLLQEGELDTTSAPRAVKMLKELALTMQRLEVAATHNVKRDAEIRRQATAKAAEAVEREAKRQGASATTIDALRAAIMTELGA